jgi:hypothetical protein
MDASGFVSRALFVTILTATLTSGPARAQFGGIKNAIDKAKKTVDSIKQTQQNPKPPQPTSGQQTPVQPPGQQTPAQEPAATPPAQPAVSQPAISPTDNPATTTALATNAVPPDKDPKASTGSSLQFTQQMYALMELRDIPQLMDDKYIVSFAAAQISKEQAAWAAIGPRSGPSGQLAEPRPSITYEWQKVVDSEPTLADGPLLDVFVLSDPDWSFLDKNPKWDPNANPQMRPVVEAFLFSKDKIEGRDPNFAARELASVAKKQLQLATKRIPTHFYFSEQLPLWKYDFGSSAFKFDGTQQMPGKINLMMPIYDPEAKVGAKDFYTRLPAQAKELVPYVLGPALQHQMPPENNPGAPVPYGSAETAWKENFIWGNIPEPVVFAIDRQLRLSSVPVDAKRAEEVSKLGGLATARVFFTADHIALENPAAPVERASRTVLFAKLEKVDIVDREGALIVTLKPETFPSASAAAAALNPPPPTTAAGKKDANCQAMAQQLAPSNSDAYQKAYQECMARQ